MDAAKETAKGNELFQTSKNTIRCLISTFNGRGSCYTVKKNHEVAVADFKKVLGIPPESRNAPLEHELYAIAENYRQQKDFPNALHWGEKALSENPNNYRHRELVTEVKKQMRDDP